MDPLPKVIFDDAKFGDLFGYPLVFGIEPSDAFSCFGIFQETGGGISDNYPVPDFQSSVALPASVNPDHRRGRGVPDVAALAARPPGYRIVIDGQEMAKDGTSAATPLWAALLAMANAGRDTPLGVAPPHLYGTPGLTRQIMTGNNQQNGIGYSAGGTWNACTGLGVPVAADIIAALATAGVA